MEQIRYRNRKLNLNGHGYYYLHLPRQAAEALGSRLIDIVVTDDGLLLQPKAERRIEA